MHPGPMNRGIEISSEVADSSLAVINEQVTNGIAVRMAVLYLLATARNKRKNRGWNVNSNKKYKNYWSFN